MKKLILISLIVLASLTLASAAPTEVILLSNTIDYANSNNLVSYLEEVGLTVTKVDSGNFNDYMDSKYIIVLGGPDSPQGIGGIVSQVLSDSEKSQTREVESKLFLQKSEIWADNQIVLLFAGNNRQGTAAAMNENREAARIRLLPAVETESTLSATIHIDLVEVKTISGGKYLETVLYNFVNTGAELFDPTVDIDVYKIGGGTSTSVYSNTQIENENVTFYPNLHRLENYTIHTKLSAGDYKLVMKLRKGSEPEALSTTERLFEV